MSTKHSSAHSSLARTIFPATVAILFAFSIATGRSASEVQHLPVNSTWQLATTGAVSLAASPALDKLAILQSDGTVEILDADSHQHTATLARLPKPTDTMASGLMDRALTYSPNGQWLGIVWGESGYMVSTEPSREPIGLGSQVWSICFSRDGQHALVCGRECWIAQEPDWKPVGRFHALPNRFAGPPVLRPLKRHGPPNRPVSSMIAAISADGSEVALGQSFFELERWGADSGSFISFASLGTNNVGSSSMVTSLHYSPDGSSLAAVLNQRSVVVVETNGVMHTLPNDWTYARGKTVAEIADAFFTPDGAELVALAEILELSPGAFETPNQRTVRAEVQFWNVKTQAMTRRLASSGPAYFRQAWLSADGRKVMAVQISYDRVPRTAAERQGEHLRSPSAPVVVVASVPLK